MSPARSGQVSAIDVDLQEALIGRGRELAITDSLMESFDNGARRACVVLSGEPGIGKSALLREVCARARSRGWQTAVGAGLELGPPAPASLLAGALEEPLATIADRLEPGRVAELARVLPALGAASGPSEANGAALHGALAAALRELAQDAPLLLALDDVQWADELSLSLLAMLLTRLPANVMIVVAHRPWPRSDALARAIGRRPIDGDMHRLELEPLDPANALLLLDGIPPAQGREILRASGGNPLYLRELAHAARTGGAPLGLRAAVAAEMAALTPSAAVLARAAAVLGDPFDPWLAQRISGLPQWEADDALEQLVAAGIVRPAESPERWTFRHPIVAETIWHETPGAWRTSAHARADELLAASGAPATARARHIEHSARAGDAQAAELLATAGSAVIAHDPRAAARWFEAALRLLPPDAPRRQVKSLLFSLAGARVSSGEIEAARVPLAEAAALLPHLPPDARRTPPEPLIRVASLLAVEPEVLAILRDANVDIPIVHTLLAVGAWVSGDWEEMAAHAAQARAHGDADANLATQAAALAALAACERGRPDEAAAAFAAAVRASDDVPPDEPCLDVTLSLAVAAERLERYDHALRLWEQLLEAARLFGHELAAVPALLGQASTHLKVGRLPAAARAAEEASESASTLSDQRARALAALLAGRVALARGDADAAVVSSAAATTALGVGAALFGVVPSCELAAARIAQGEIAAIDELVTAAGGPTLERIAPTQRARIALTLVEAELARGQVEAARAWSNKAAAFAAAVGTGGAAAEAELSRARVLIAEGAHKEAIEAAERAEQRFTAVGRRLDAIVASAAHGEAQAHAGGPDADAGVERLRHAHAALETIGAGRDRDAVAQALRRLGRRVPARRRSAVPQRGAAALSPREREVAALVATGISNREIAERLVISEKTVESHLSRIFAKLGVNNRTAAVHALTAAGAPLVGLVDPSG